MCWVLGYTGNQSRHPVPAVKGREGRLPVRQLISLGLTLLSSGRTSFTTAGNKKRRRQLCQEETHVSSSSNCRLIIQESYQLPCQGPEMGRDSYLCWESIPRGPLVISSFTSDKLGGAVLSQPPALRPLMNCSVRKHKHQLLCTLYKTHFSHSEPSAST